MREIKIIVKALRFYKQQRGAWSYLITDDTLNKIEKLEANIEEHTDFIKLELTGIIEALNTINFPCNITIFTYSKFGKIKPSDNSNLWKKLISLSKYFNIKQVLIKKHDPKLKNTLIKCNKIMNLKNSQYIKKSNIVNLKIDNPLKPNTAKKIIIKMKF